MRDRRAGHVRPLPPSGDRLRSRQITAASAPPRDLLRRYKPGRSSRQVPPPLSLGVIALFLILGVVMLVVGGNLLVNIAGQVASAFDNAMTRVASMAPATPAPSGVALDTPVLNAPPNDGYTNQTVVSLSGTVPGDAIGQNGYTVRAYAVAANGSRIKVAEVNVGGTSRFDTPAVSLIEGPNSFVATLVTPGGEGQPSPLVTYILDTAPPVISLGAPADGSTVSGKSVVVSGKTDPGATVTVRNKMAPGGGISNKIVGTDGRFAISIPLVSGSNTVDIVATDQAGNVTTLQIVVKRSYGQLAAHVTAAPARWKASSPQTLKMTVRVTSSGGGPLAGATVVFTVGVAGLAQTISGPITTDETGTATWKVGVSASQPGIGQASVLVTSSDGDQTTASVRLTTY